MFFRKRKLTRQREAAQTFWIREAMREGEDRFRRMCSDDSCIYMEPHRHGFACTKGCSCNRHGRVD